MNGRISFRKFKIIIWHTQHNRSFCNRNWGNWKCIRWICVHEEKGLQIHLRFLAFHSSNLGTWWNCCGRENGVGTVLVGFERKGEVGGWIWSPWRVCFLWGWRNGCQWRNPFGRNLHRDRIHKSPSSSRLPWLLLTLSLFNTQWQHNLIIAPLEKVYAWVWVNCKNHPLTFLFKRLLLFLWGPVFQVCP